MKMPRLFYCVLSFLFLAIVFVIMFFQIKKDSSTVVFCVEKVECIRDRKFFSVKYYFSSKVDCKIRLFNPTESSPIFEGLIQSGKSVYGSSEFGPQRIHNPEKFSSITSIDVKEWLLLEEGKEYTLKNNTPLPVWKIENDGEAVSTVFVSFSR